MSAAERKRTNWKRRWIELLSAIAVAMLLASIDVADSQDSRFAQIARMLLAAVLLILGIYVFVRPDETKTPKTPPN